MIIRIKPRQEGIVQYLKTGKRPDSNLSRNEKDLVVSIEGDLDFVDKTIKQAQATKKWSDYYQHITIGFTNEDFDKFYDPQYDAWDLDKLQSIVNEFVELYFSGYDKNEYTYYAELHYPKIKINEQGKERLPHIHIVIPIMNLVSNTKLLPIKWSIKNNDLLQTYLAKKYNLDLPIYHQREKREPLYISKEGLKRKKLQELLKDIKTEQKLLQFFKDNNLQYRKVETKKNTYYKILNPAGKDINLRGRGMEHLEEIAKFGVVKNLPKKKLSIAEQHAQMTLAELENELREYIRKRVEEISKRRSRKATQELMKLKEQTDNRVQNSISTYKDIKKQFQERLLEEIYNTYIPLRDKGFWVEKKEDRVKIKNFKKGIDLEDRGNILIAKGNNLQEQVKLMLDLAEAKGWDLATIQVNGSEEFKKEVYRQIKERLKVKELQQKQISQPSKLPFLNRREPPKRPSNYTEQAYKERQEEKKLDKNYIKEIKENLDAKRVLEYAVNHYALDKSKYEIIGNKIKNLTNRQKPKSVIDFLQKEVGLSVKEAFSIADELYQEQLKKSNLEERINMRLSYNFVKGYTYISDEYFKENIAPKLKYGWKVKEVKTKLELETLVKNYFYSPFVFENGYRKSEQAKKVTALILDFDNDKKDYLITMQEVAERLKQKGIKALLVETKNSNKEKKGIVFERFRVIIPITKEIDIKMDDRNAYKRAVANFTNDLGLFNYIDAVTIDFARMYHPSPSTAKSIVINGNAVDFEKMLINAKEQLIKEQEEKEEQLRKEKEQRLAKLQSIESNISAYTYNAGDTTLTGLTYADIDKIMSIPFEYLISIFEGIEREYKEGSYRMIKTPNAKYSILKDGEVIHDFKSGKTYNKISYLYKKLGVNNLMSLARALQNITGEEYIKVNENLVNSAIKKATEQAKDLKEFNEIVKNVCNVNFVRVDLKNNIIKIADIEVNADTKAILEKINKNKTIQEAEEEITADDLEGIEVVDNEEVEIVKEEQSHESNDYGLGL